MTDSTRRCCPPVDDNKRPPPNQLGGSTTYALGPISFTHTFCTVRISAAIMLQGLAVMAAIWGSNMKHAQAEMTGPLLPASTPPVDFVHTATAEEADGTVRQTPRHAQRLSR